jgi:signal transduction histidine kinase
MARRAMRKRVQAERAQGPTIDAASARADVARRSSRKEQAMAGERIRGMLIVAFGLIVVTVALGSVIGMSRAHEARMQVAPTLANTFTSVELVSRISREFSRERLLVDTHIAESQKVGMERVAASIADAERALDEATAALDRLPLSGAEEAVWARVRADLAAMQPGIAEVLALSSQNHDVEAARRLALLDGRFAGINAELMRLVELNRTASLRTLGRANALERSASIMSGALTLAAIVLVIAVGIATTRLVGRRERQILVYAARLEEQNRELDAFAGRVAHDLRGPLTAMSMAASRMLERRSDESGTVAALIRRSVGRMERLITDLLALSQVETQSRGASCDPAAVAASVRDELGARVEAAEATLRFDVQPATVHGRDGLLIEALTNLVENAIKYRREEVAPVVEVIGRIADSWYTLSVTDNGMGMSPEEARRVFEPFYRAARGAMLPGTGLGLSIVKRVAEASGGSVTVRSALGQGSTFMLRLPLLR